MRACEFSMRSAVTHMRPATMVPNAKRSRLPPSTVSASQPSTAVSPTMKTLT
jgi:hypothetical protein